MHKTACYHFFVVRSLKDINLFESDILIMKQVKFQEKRLREGMMVSAVKFNRFSKKFVLLCEMNQDFCLFLQFSNDASIFQQS